MSPTTSSEKRKAAKQQTKHLGQLPAISQYKQKMIIPLCNFLVRPHLEYAVHIGQWSEHLRRDIDKIEMVQKSAPKMIPEI